MSAVLDSSEMASATHPAPASDKTSVEIHKLSKRLHRLVGQASADFKMIEAGDKVMVCVSGGKVIGTLRRA